MSKVSRDRSKYVVYKEECLRDGNTPLTENEWRAEGGLTYAESLRLSYRYHNRQLNSWADAAMWVIPTYH